MRTSKTSKIWFAATMAALVVGMASVGTAVSHGVVIVAFGDSTTALRAPAVPKVYAQILQDQLPGLLGESVTVYNAGVGGNSTYEALNRFNSDVRARNPNIVIVQFGINDSWIYSNDENGASYVPINATVQAGSPNAIHGNYTSNLTSIVDTLKGDGARVVLMTPNQLQTTGPGAGAVWRNDLLGTYAQVVRNVAAAEHVELLDVWQMYSDYAAIPGHNVNDLLADSQHPGPLGHQMEADGLIAMIVPEPSVLVMAATGLLASVGYLRRKRRSACA